MASGNRISICSKYYIQAQTSLLEHTQTNLFKHSVTLTETKLTQAAQTANSSQTTMQVSRQSVFLDYLNLVCVEAGSVFAQEMVERISTLQHVYRDGSAHLWVQRRGAKAEGIAVEYGAGQPRIQVLDRASCLLGLVRAKLLPCAPGANLAVLLATCRREACAFVRVKLGCSMTQTVCSSASFRRGSLRGNCVGAGEHTAKGSSISDLLTNVETSVKQVLGQVSGRCRGRCRGRCWGRWLCLCKAVAKRSQT